MSGKAKKGSPPKRRSVLTVWAWSSEILQEWFTEVRPGFGTGGNPAAWPSERGPESGVSGWTPGSPPTGDELGLDAGLDLHSLRRSYVTHLIEDGYDARFVQE